MTADGMLSRRAQGILTTDAVLAGYARSSLLDFYRFVFGYDVPPHIRLMIECLQALEARQITRLLIICPPGHAKSTIASLCFPAWYIGRHPEHSIIGATTTGRLAEMYSDSVAELIESDERFAMTFPSVRPDRKRGWSRDGLFVTRKRRPGDKDASLALVGAGGPIIGRRADVMIIDDAVDEPVARSDIRLKARVEWVQRSVRSRLKPNGLLVAAGTVWDEGDVLNSLTELGTFVKVTMRALSPTTEQYADVEIPDGINWRPTGAVAIAVE
jgi:hypothetical protein